MIVALGLSVAGYVALFDRHPVVEEVQVAAPSDADRLRGLFKEFRALTEGDAAGEPLTLHGGDINSALAIAGRFLPMMRGHSSVSPDGVEVLLSAQLPMAAWAGWINLRAVVEPSETGLEFSDFRIGSIGLPTGMILPAGAMVLDLVLGGGAGAIASRAIAGVAIEDDNVRLNIGMTGSGRKELASNLKSRLRSAAFRSRPDDVAAYLAAFDAAAGDGRLEPSSFTQHLRFLLAEAARRGKEGNPRRQIEAALFALAIDCGARKFENVIGEAVPPTRRGQAPCASARLAGRIDLRRHFALSAGLHAASNAGAAFAAGELKELLDSRGDGSGFSFDDLLADRAGIRFAEVLFASGPDDWMTLAARLSDDSDLLPEHEDLPSGLSEAAFAERYSSIDSASYAETIRLIDERLAATRFFAIR